MLGPAVDFFHVNDGQDVLAVPVNGLNEIFKLCRCTRQIGEVMITACLKAVLAGIVEILFIFGIGHVAANRGSDVNIFYLGLFFELSPVDFTIVLGYVYAVKLHLVGVHGDLLGFWRGHSLVGGVGNGLLVFLISVSRLGCGGFFDWFLGTFLFDWLGSASLSIS